MLGTKILKSTTALALCFSMAGVAYAEPTELRVVIKDTSESNP